MNIFFYSVDKSKCKKVCCYKTCSQKCLHVIQGLSCISDLKILPGGSMLNTPSSMEMRTGDIIIIYAANTQAILSLLPISHLIDTYRVILILGDMKTMSYGHHYELSPRYTTTLENDFGELNEVVHRMSRTANQETASKTMRWRYSHA